MEVILDITAFRTEFPEFANETTFPDIEITQAFETAKIYLSGSVDITVKGLTQQTELLYLMTAHLIKIRIRNSSGKDNKILSATSVGSVSVSLVPPPVDSANYAWWLNTTPYGQRLYALASQIATGGFYVSGRNEIGSFRREGGYFG